MKPRSAYRLAFPNSLILVISVLLFALSTTRVAQATDFTVTTTDDTNDGVCDADCSLREAISAANVSPGADIITVPAGVYTLTIDKLEITGPTTLNGAGAGVTVIDGNSSWDVLTINGQEGAPIAVTLADLTLRHGLGGIMANYVDLVVSRTEVISNTAGSGVFITSGTLALQASTVAWNATPYNGGGILASGTRVTVADSAIISNTASQGAGITFWGDGPSLTVLSSTISYNTARGSYLGGEGGGIRALGGALTLQDSTITWNTSAEDGGGLRLLDVTDLDISGSTIAYNTTGRGGGGVSFVQAQSLPTTVKIAETKIISNTAGTTNSFEGGGIYVWQDGFLTEPLTMTLTNSSVLSNTAGSRGGGIFFSGGRTPGSQSSITLENSSIAGNTAGGNTAGSGGGGIFWFGTHGRLFITSSAIANNTASGLGGGLDFEGGDTGSLLIENSVIERNVALSGGGLIAYVGPGSSVAHTIIRANQAIASADSLSGYGGGIRHEHNELRLSNVTLTDNTAAKDGGGAYGNFREIVDSQIVNNIAAGDGGGLAGGGTLLRSTVTGNRAANGGGLALLEADVAQSLIAGNSATEKGGGISVLNAYKGGPTVKIHNSTISGNHAGQSAGISHGGPVYKLCQGPNTTFQYGYGGKMLLDNATIAANVSVTGTGGIRVNIEDRDRDAVEQAECPNGFVNWDTGSDVIETEMVNVLVAENTGDNCTDVAADASQGHNLSDDATCLFTAAGDQTKLDAKLGPLQNNGGPTWTHALLAGSPAIDSASNASCPATDQRGVVRPQGVACDIGAYEFTATTAFLAITPQTLTFAAVAGANPPPAQGFQIANTGVGVLNWTASEAVSWLSLDKTSGTAPATVNLTFDTANLTPGSYNGAITISASGANGSPQTVSIALQVVSAANLLKNGNFEAGRTGWTETSSKERALIRQGGDVPFTTPRSGSWAAVLGQENGETSDLSQAVLLPGGDDLALIYYTFGQSAESRCDLEIAEVRINSSKVASHPLCLANNSSGWTKQTVDLNPYRGQNVTLHFYLKNDGISDPSTLLVDDVQLQFGVESAMGAVTPANGGAVTSGDGKINITFPPGAVNEPIDVTIMTQGAPSQPAGGYRFAGKSFVVEATDSSGRPVTQFNQPFTLRVDYADSDWQNAGITEESDLNLYFWNGAQWTPLLPCAGCTHDLTANRFVAVLDHLTEFAMLAEGGAASLFLPVVTR